MLEGTMWAVVISAGKYLAAACIASHYAIKWLKKWKEKRGEAGEQTQA